jgi:tRNA (adenine57-N1/adenine58-N1)-methyltransferase
MMMAISKKLSSHTKVGDLAQLLRGQEKGFIFPLNKGGSFQSHHGIIHHEDLIGVLWGSKIKTHKGVEFTLLHPALDDLLRSVQRETQIMYPKDIGYLIMTMGISPGCNVIEAGSGSGALTTALAYIVGKEGKVYSYEKKENNLKIAKANIEQFGLQKQVVFKHKDIAEGFDEADIHALFLDLPDPENYIRHSREALISGGFFGSILPTTNQVSTLVTALKQHNFGNIEISEMLHRYYKASATRFRPADKMVAHTGFLIFARKYAHRHEMKDHQ